MIRWMPATAAILLAIATALGAFGAHGLEGVLSPDRLAVYETGVRYVFFHSLGLLAIGLTSMHLPPRSTRIVAILLLVGMALFSGSIFALTFGAPRWFGAVAPLGGMSLMVAWILFAVSTIRKRPPGVGRSAPADITFNPH